jgi:hypothetical protein
MKVIVKKLTKEQTLLEVETRNGIKLLDINKTAYGYSYKDFTEWDITDNQYYQLEELIDNIIDRMKGYDDLEVIYEH